MSLHTETNIYIKGKLFSSQFNSLSLYQEIGAHHHLEIAFRMDDFEKLVVDIEASKGSLFGEKISVKISEVTKNNPRQELEFIGYITQIKQTSTDNSGASDEIVVIANSPTIFADDGPNYRLFEKQTPSQIVKKVLDGYSEIASSVNSELKKEELHYSIQHNESSFDYVCRLAAQYGVWCFYNGTKFIFGKPNDEREIALHFPDVLKEFNISQLPQPMNFEFVSPDPFTKSVHSVKTNTSSVLDPKTLFKEDHKKVLLNVSPVRSNGLRNNLAEDQGKALAINQDRFTGISTNPELILGCIIMPGNGTAVIGNKYRIIKISHTCNEIGNYENHFEAVSSKYDVYPYTNIGAYPVSQNQIGKVVKSDEDPDDLGRIQVKLFYLEEPIWMRMITPHAGINRGFFFLPEVDDEVLVGFEGGNAEAPYVLGSLYNKIDKPPYKTDQDNTKKAIVTKSGLKIEFDDENTIFTIITPVKNTIILSDKDQKITVSTSKKRTITLCDKKEEISILDENKNKIIMNAEGISIESSKDLKLKAMGNIALDGANIEHTAQGKFAAKANGMAEISSSGNTTVKGSMVMIN